MTRSSLQASPLLLQLPLLQPLAVAAICWTGAGATVRTTTGMEATAAGVAGMAAAVAVTTMVSPLLQPAAAPVMLLLLPSCITLFMCYESKCGGDFPS